MVAIKESDYYDYEVVTCLIEKDGEQLEVLAIVVPFQGNLSRLEFAIEPPYDVLVVNGVSVS